MVHNRWRFQNADKRKNKMLQKSENEKNAKFYDALITRFTVAELRSGRKYFIAAVKSVHKRSYILLDDWNTLKYLL